MTHDELLADIDMTFNTIGGSNRYAEKAVIALRAVVELTKPDDSDEVYPENKLWKSIIIQAIEKELK